MRRFFLCSLSTLVLGTGASAALAQVWAHVDENGVTQFTNLPQAHARLVLAGPEPVAVPSAGLEQSARQAVAVVSAKPVFRELQPHLQEVAATHGVDPALVKAVAELGRKEREVMRLRFGLGGDEPKTLQEVGDRLKLSRERVRQIESRAKEKLRQSMRLRGMKSSLN